MTRYPHRIRLRGPWECEPVADRSGRLRDPARLRMTLPCRWADGGLRDFSGRVRFRRRFGYPGQIDNWERVWITNAGVSDRAVVQLNGADLGEWAGDGPFEFDATRLLRQRNELVVDVDGAAETGGLWGETALEVRCTAFLRGVRVWWEGGAWRAAGLVVGEAPRPLDLYVLIDGATVAYTTVVAAPGGAPFHIIADIEQPRADVAWSGDHATAEPEALGHGLLTVPPSAGARSPDRAPCLAQVDLVNGAVVWYTTALELPTAPPGD